MCYILWSKRHRGQLTRRRLCDVDRRVETKLHRVTVAEGARLPDAWIRGHSDGEGRSQGAANLFVSKMLQEQF